VRHSGANLLACIRMLRGVAPDAGPSVITPAALLSRITFPDGAPQFDSWLVSLFTDLTALLTSHRGEARVVVPLFKTLEIVFSEPIVMEWAHLCVFFVLTYLSAYLN
jgi:hypothetical protein